MLRKDIVAREMSKVGGLGQEWKAWVLLGRRGLKYYKGIFVVCEPTSLAVEMLAGWLRRLES